jgi:hypothetical protein
MAEWTEVNIIPSGQPEQLILGLVEPLIHQVLAGHWDNWHCFWETQPIGKLHLRLRIRWLDPSQTTGDGLLSAYLADQENKRNIDSWFPGDNGQANQVYMGEASFYGPEVWELTYKDWTSGSELALAIINFDSQKKLSKERQFHWERRAHLFANELLLPESLVSLYQALAYSSPQDHAHPQIGPILQAIRQLFP